MEYWFWDAGAMVYWEDGPDKNIKNRKLPLKTSFHHSIIPSIGQKLSFPKTPLT